jgi:hypothetical protein
MEKAPTLPIREDGGCPGAFLVPGSDKVVAKAKGCCHSHLTRNYLRCEPMQTVLAHTRLSQRSSSSVGAREARAGPRRSESGTKAGANGRGGGRRGVGGGKEGDRRKPLEPSTVNHVLRTQEKLTMLTHARRARCCRGVVVEVRARARPQEHRIGDARSSRSGCRHITLCDSFAIASSGDRS